MRIISKSASRGQAYVDVATSANPRGMQPGKQYTMRVTVRMGAARGFTGPWMSYGVTKKTAADAGGQQTLELTFTIPTDTTDWQLRLYNGGKIGDPDVWWDDLRSSKTWPAKGCLVEHRNLEDGCVVRINPLRCP